MREIKFRAWDKLNKKMLDDADLWEWSYETVFRSCDHECILMQFTGLKDKNGKEIYEGDILGDGIVVEVQFHDGKFVGVQSNKKYSLGDCCGNYGRILGNIYENPELLKSRTAPKL
jgi:hypothetical protein